MARSYLTRCAYYTKADMNKDGKVNAADIVLLTNEIK